MLRGSGIDIVCVCRFVLRVPDSRVHGARGRLQFLSGFFPLVGLRLIVLLILRIIRALALWVWQEGSVIKLLQVLQRLDDGTQCAKCAQVRLDLMTSFKRSKSFQHSCWCSVLNISCPAECPAHRFRKTRSHNMDRTALVSTPMARSATPFDGG